MRRTTLSFIAFAIFFAIAPHHAHAQVLGQQPAGAPTLQQPIATGPASLNAQPEVDPAKERFLAEQRKAQEADNYKHLKADADRLLALATELKAEVDKTTKDELSIAVVKKAAEMEKLSHDLKDRMREP